MRKNNNGEYIPQCAMSIHAHPDDQEFTVGGTLAKWTLAGCKVVSVLVTSGEAGNNDPSKDISYKPVLAQIREAEQTAANEVLGIKTTIFLRYPDSEVEPTIQLRKELTRLIRLHKPDVVVTSDPQGVFYGNGYINHPDHRAVAQAALYATFPSAGVRLVFTDLLEAGYEPHAVKRVYIHGSEKPDTRVNIYDTLDIKIAALKKHASQMSDGYLENMMQQWVSQRDKMRGRKYTEDFKVMILAGESPNDISKFEHELP